MSSTMRTSGRCVRNALLFLVNLREITFLSHTICYEAHFLDVRIPDGRLLLQHITVLR